LFVSFIKGLHEEDTDGSNPLNPGNFKKVKLIPDGACLFTRGMGMSCTWESERGFGERSWRYSAVINDGKIEKLFVEVNRYRRPGKIFAFIRFHCILPCITTYLLLPLIRSLCHID
jgi:hypothetical protein